ncbi:MAG: hypothetical protein JWO13_2329 [Acidobacteriales bacterium]|nr:hypothetical protein [Terriglobales bacterium]
MTKRVVVGGFLAGLVMFIWSSVAHMALPVGEIGLSTIANEDAVLAAMKTSTNEPGLYFLPGHAFMTSPAAEKQKAMQEMTTKSKTAGSMIIDYHPQGAPEITLKTLGLEFLSDVVAGWILAFALWAALPRIGSLIGRVGLVAGLGLLPFIVSDFSQWNWYGYPTAYEIGQVLDYGVGALLAGVFLAWFLKSE